MSKLGVPGQRPSSVDYGLLVYNDNRQRRGGKERGRDRDRQTERQTNRTTDRCSFLTKIVLRGICDQNTFRKLAILTSKHNLALFDHPFVPVILLRLSYFSLTFTCYNSVDYSVLAAHIMSQHPSEHVKR